MVVAADLPAGLKLAFCPTGKGGGKDNSCSSKDKSGGESSSSASESSDSSGVTSTPEFKKWFADSKVVDDKGEPLVMYHGANRSDRINNVFDPARATSGPMQYFIDDPEIASNYSEGKQDTSLEMPEDYADWFKVEIKGESKNIEKAWHSLPTDDKSKIASMLPHVTNLDEDGNEIDGYRLGGNDEYGLAGKEHWDYEIKSAKGNVLKAAKEIWLNGGTMVGSEEEFLTVLNLGGMKGVELDDPNRSHSGVVPVYLSIKNPLDTADVPAKVVKALRTASKGKEAGSSEQRGDLWSKWNRSGKDWMDALDDDLKTDNTLAWTSVPDWVTETLAKQGYDGIKDTGGKMGGREHAVYVPFKPHQIKSAIGNKGAFDANSTDITLSFIKTGLEVELPEGLKLAFCATGKGGGQDNSCSSKDGGKGGGKITKLTAAQAKKLTIPKTAKLLAERGYTLGAAKFDHASKKTSYTVTHLKTGNKTIVPTDKIKEFLQTDKTTGLFKAATSNKPIVKAEVSKENEPEDLPDDLKVIESPSKEVDKSASRGKVFKGEEAADAFGNKLYADWKENLSADSFEAIKAYSEDQYQAINDHLREVFNDDEQQPKIDAIDAALNAAPALTEDIVIYRGVNADAGLKFKVGGTITDKAYMSTSLNEHVAKDLVEKEKGTLLSIKAPAGTKGAYIDSISSHDTEQEFLLPRGTRLRITGVKKLTSKIDLVEAEVITGED